MEIKSLHNKTVGVLGYGIEGKAVVKYLLKHGIKPVIFDQRLWEECADIEKLDIKKLGVNFIFGPDCFKELYAFDIAFRSPGVKLSAIADYELWITSQTKWFFEHCPAKIIGVTGTKGKGTTASLVYEMLKAGGRGKGEGVRTHANPYLTGNIGKTQPFDILDDLEPDDWVVYELSSFQLQDLKQSPHIAVTLMVTSEHLDYHKDNQEYIEAKSSIAKFQIPGDFSIINADYENSIIIGERGEGQKLYFSRTRTDADCFVQNGEVVLKNFNASTSSGQVFKFPISSLQLRGSHNLENVSAAILAAQSAGAEHGAIKTALENFKGLEHRLEFVAEKNGVKFYNDSFSTIPETAIAAIKSFNEPEILILGGSSKNSDFTELAECIVAAENIKALILIGDEAEKIEAQINKAGGFKNFILTGANNMVEIMEQVKSVAQAGDVVLLSPACASFGTFNSYKDRGEQFKHTVDLY